MNTVNKSWVCPKCKAQNATNIRLLDGPSIKCESCGFVQIFTDFLEADRNGWHFDELELRRRGREESP